MAASQRYLSLLQEVAATRPSISNEELPAAIEYLWDRLGTGSRETDQPILLDLARHIYAHIAFITNKPLNTVLAEAASLHEKKNAGYAGGNKDPWANFRLSKKFGIPPRYGILVRMSDKYIRWHNVTRDPSNEQVNESVIETLSDFAAYALIAFCIGEERWNGK